MRAKSNNKESASNYQEHLNWFNKYILPVVTTKHTNQFKPIVLGTETI